MGTRGYYSFKFHGIYYNFYNHFDSYPDAPNGLGHRIVQELSSFSIHDLEKMKDLVKTIPKIRHYGDECNFEGLKVALENYPIFEYYTSEDAPEPDLFIEYIYIIDLDDFRFLAKSNKNQVEYAIYQIPIDWNDNEFR